MFGVNEDEEAAAASPPAGAVEMLVAEADLDEQDKAEHTAVVLTQTLLGSFYKP